MSEISLNDIVQITSLPKITDSAKKPKITLDAVTIKELLLEPCAPIEPDKPDCQVIIEPITDWSEVDLDWASLFRSYTAEELIDLLKELAVRFDTSPRQLEKMDFYTLIKVLCGLYSS